MCIRYINNVETIKIIKRKFLIFCNKTFNYVPTNQLMFFISDLNITNIELIHLFKLKQLYLMYNTNITDEGLKYLPNLTRLYLPNNKNITISGLQYLPALLYYNTFYISNVIMFACKF